MTSKTLIHIGLHKTGTTVLQKSLFLEENGFLPFEPRQNLLSLFVNKSSIGLFSDQDIHAFSIFTKTAEKKNLLPTISMERLSGYPLSGGYDRLSIWNRIQQLPGEKKIFVVIREQASWLYSAWKQTIVDGADISLIDFLAPTDVGNVRLPVPRLDYLNYFDMVVSLRTMFGEENVCVLPWEMMINDKLLFSKHLSYFTGIREENMRFTDEKINTSRSLSTIYALKLFHSLLFKTSTSKSGFIMRDRSAIERKLYQSFYKLAHMLPTTALQKTKSREHKALISTLVRQEYSATNAELSKLINIPLSDYGYSS